MNKDAAVGSNPPCDETKPVEQSNNVKADEQMLFAANQPIHRPISFMLFVPAPLLIANW